MKRKTLNLLKTKKPSEEDFFVIFHLVGRDGFEPSKAQPTDLQSVAFDRSATYPNVAVAGGYNIPDETLYWVENYCDWS